METGIATHRVLTGGLELQDRPTRVTRTLLGWHRSGAGHRAGTLATRVGGALRIVTASPVTAGGRMAQWHAFAAWCAGGVVLLLPGSFVVLAVLWICRNRVLSRMRP